MKTATIRVGEVDVQLLREGDAIMRMMANGKLWEPETREIWGRLVYPGDCMIDVGAYTGVYAIASALMGAKVSAIEPHYHNYRRLRHNAAINGVTMEMLRVAASNRTIAQVSLRMKHLDCLSDTASLVEPWPYSQLVRSVRIDDLDVPGEVGLIKIDVEHHETIVLAGAKRTIMEHRPLVLVECLTPQAVDMVDTIMREMGYSVAKVFDNRNRLYKPSLFVQRLDIARSAIGLMAAQYFAGPMLV
jgi:FkbM family methyltransferase